MIKIKDNPKSWKLILIENSKCKRFAQYQGDGWHDDKRTEVENFIFKAKLKPEYTTRGRSATDFLFEDTDTGEIFNMKPKQVMEMLKELLLGSVANYNGYIDDEFTFFKQGENYSIGLYRK